MKGLSNNVPSPVQGTSEKSTDGGQYTFNKLLTLCADFSAFKNCLSKEGFSRYLYRSDELLIVFCMFLTFIQLCFEIYPLVLSDM